MSDPLIEILPLRSAVRSDAETTLDVLIRISPPVPDVQFVRPPINLGLVLDRSGSMIGTKKIEYARTAAKFAVENLLETDRVSITLFDDYVDTIAPSTLVKDKAGLTRLLAKAEPRGGTNLHAGWVEGASQVGKNLVANGLNRVILLSDGQANQGVTDPTTIATEVKGRTAQGVSTTTIGLGDDYNEDLMEDMAKAGDGNYYFVESPVQLADIFQTELLGLMATVGEKVSLGIEPKSGARVSDVLNELDKNSFGRLMLPNLILSMPLAVVVRLVVPATSVINEVLDIRLAWDEPRGSKRRTLRSTLRLAPVSSSQFSEMPADPAVAEQVALLMSARAKKEAVAAVEFGDTPSVANHVNMAFMVTRSVPLSASIAQEIADIQKLQSDLEQGAASTLRKRAKIQALSRHRGKTS